MTPAPSDNNPSLPRAIGRFFGHIVQAVKAPAPTSEREEVSRTTQETQGHMGTDTGTKKVVLRRTTIDEIEYKDD